MLAASREWRSRQAPGDVAAELEHDLRLGRIPARLLALRGVHGAQAAERFLARRLADLHRPEQMLGIPAAARRLAEAINRRERILIHGDYDVDGSTACALLALFVHECSHQAVPWIPHRRIDGYGLSESSLHAVQEHRAQVMVTVDCGIADGGWAARIERETGCAVIVTDHHLPSGSLPSCTAVCNPNQPGCPYPDKGLAGVGVAWKLAWATAVELSGSERVTERLRSFLLDALSLVAIGTVADCAPLTGENRILVHHGLQALGRSNAHGLRSLLGQAGLEGQTLAAGDVGWRIGPLLNASGRVGSAMANVRLLTATTAEEAAVELKAIVAENEERKRLTQVLTADLLAEAERDTALRSRAALVFAGEGWHQGVVGIVASRLVEHFGRPAVVIAINDGQGKGSMRTIPEVHLGEAIDACRAHLLRGGGHAMAAGMTIDPAQVPAFREAFEAHVARRVVPGALTPRTEFDGEARLADLDAAFFTSLERMAPFGNGNPEPVLRLQGASFVTRPRLFGKEGEHIRGALTDGGGGGMRELFAWRSKERFAALSAPGHRFDLLVKPQISHWRGEVQHRLVLVDSMSSPG